MSRRWKIYKNSSLVGEGSTSIPEDFNQIRRYKEKQAINFYQYTMYSYDSWEDYYKVDNKVTPIGNVLSGSALNEHWNNLDGGWSWIINSFEYNISPSSYYHTHAEKAGLKSLEAERIQHSNATSITFETKYKFNTDVPGLSAYSPPTTWSWVFYYTELAQEVDGATFGVGQEKVWMDPGDGITRYYSISNIMNKTTIFRVIFESDGVPIQPPSEDFKGQSQLDRWQAKVVREGEHRGRTTSWYTSKPTRIKGS